SMRHAWHPKQDEMPDTGRCAWRGLKGVGEVKAKAIVEYRTAHGPFVSLDQLLEVKGVGPALLEKNRERIAIE
ncbi:helix-hairpin-helix domain-containing protein, partial [Pseudomonas aeruginosa]|uniref:ComEA family DNA-binding protein n=1 Tax=Pseudomonas aeruginosa TaxID=287 RepID=UPI0031B778C7